MVEEKVTDSPDTILDRKVDRVSDILDRVDSTLDRVDPKSVPDAVLTNSKDSTPPAVQIQVPFPNRLRNKKKAGQFVKFMEVIKNL